MLFSVLTGLAFTIIITRKLPPADFGFWQVISITAVYFILTVDIVKYWAPRFIARGNNVAKSSLVFSTGLGILASLGYITFSYILCNTLSLEFFYFLVFSPQVFLSYISMTLEGVSQGYAPQYLGYSSTLFEIVKVTVAYLAIITWNQWLLDALIAVMLAQLAKAVYLLAVTWPVVREGCFELEHVKHFIKFSWIPLYYHLTDFISVADVYIVVYFAKSTIPVAVFRVAQVLAQTVFYSSAFSQALYPRILAKKSGVDVEETLRLTFMFAFPICAGLLVMAPSLLCIFGVKYLVAVHVLLVMAPALFLASLAGVLEIVIIGSEEVDSRKEAGFREYLKSRLFLLPTVKSIFQCVYLAILASLLILRIFDAALAWAFAYALGQMLFLLWECWYSKKTIEFRFPLRSALKYFLASVVMGVVLFYLGAGNIIIVKIFELLPRLFKYIVLGATIYFAIVLALDQYARSLVVKAIKFILNEVTER